MVVMMVMMAKGAAAAMGAMGAMAVEMGTTRRARGDARRRAGRAITVGTRTPRSTEARFSAQWLVLR